MGKLLWEPSAQRKAQANITRFIEYVNRRHGTAFRSYRELHDWSVTDVAGFWAAIWDFAGVRCSRGYERVVDDPTRMPGAVWFSGARLNFAENLLRHRDDQAAFVFRGETQKAVSMSYAELYDAVARLARSLRDMGVQPGDRVAAYMPNMIETAVAMLAAASIGAVWVSCATDLGPGAVLDRFGQIEPKVLFTVDGYFYKGRTFSTIPNAAQVAAGIPSVERVVVVSYAGDGRGASRIPNGVRYDDFVSPQGGLAIDFEQLPFDHPVFIMFSSGTTGKPKCMVQGAGGVLINHLKELMLHTDLKREDRIMYITTCSWMMWNWLLSSLGVGATVVLYDGNPAYPDPGAMWKLIQDERITVFGTSATYINALRSQGVRPGEDYDLAALRQISQTGSPLSADGFEYVYRDIKADLHLNSISGGTDINGCFAAGDPTGPVYAGELQGPCLGMKVRAYDESGNPVLDQQGELVCEAAAPSMPLYFWDDPDGERYREAYFTVYPGVWRHGDYIVEHSDTGGLTFFGRSDSVLKPSGVRIGTAEIYNQMERLEEVADSIAIGQSWQGDQRIVLFVVLKEGYELTAELEDRIRRTLRDNASHRHVPAKVVQVRDIPYTLNMKKMESAVTNIIHGRPVVNREALMNPECLDCYEGLDELQT